MKAIYDFGIETNGEFIWNASEKVQAELQPGNLVGLNFGEMGWGGMPKRRGSYQWVAILERDGDHFLGMTLQDGYYTWPAVYTVIRFTKDQVCDIGNPNSVAQELKETRALREQEIQRSSAAA